jgi:hypothetical protein
VLFAMQGGYDRVSLWAAALVLRLLG